MIVERGQDNWRAELFFVDEIAGLAIIAIDPEGEMTQAETGAFELALVQVLGPAIALACDGTAGIESHAGRMKYLETPVRVPADERHPVVRVGDVIDIDEPLISVGLVVDRQRSSGDASILRPPCL
jgi:hypothetical protein